MVFQQKVEERFHRNTTLPASEDVARRVFLLLEGKIQLTYHTEYYATIPSKRLFIKPLAATESRRAEDFTSANLRTFQVVSPVSSRPPPPGHDPLHVPVRRILPSSPPVG